MSDITYVGRQMRSFDSSSQFDGFSRVVIVVSDDVEYSAGTDTGRTLTLTCPWGTQKIAEDTLARIRGYQYQPYTANDAILDPAAELGDGITANNVYGGIYTQKTKFGRDLRATVSAPSDEEIDHEYPYVPKQERTVTRRLYNLTSELKVQAGLISAEVQNRKSADSEIYSAMSVQADRITLETNERKSDVSDLHGQLVVQADQISAEVSARTKDVSDLRSSINIQAGQIEAKVNKTGGSSSSFGWVLDDSSWTIKANGTTILTATQSGLEVRGKITATSGTIGGFTINSNYISYNNQTWGGTNTTGIYIGPSGIQLGQNFKVDANGNLTATTGTFTGAVYAGNIQYGGSYGTLSGSALTGHSVCYDQIGYNEIYTAHTSRGINISLGYADFANGVLNGWNTADNIYANSITAKSSLYIPYSGGTRKVSVKTVSIGGYVYNILTI